MLSQSLRDYLIRFIRTVAITYYIIGKEVIAGACVRIYRSFLVMSH